MDPDLVTSTGAPLTLRAWTRNEEDSKQSLSNLIARINAQEGSFRSITEDSLEEAARNNDSEALPNANTIEEFGSESDEKPKGDGIQSSRADIIKLADQAWGECSHTLDFISLLVSQFNPKTAEYTITPFIKQRLPLGSIGSEVLEVPPEKANLRISNDLTSFGWKLESLTASADSLLRAASKLEKEMDKEVKYWDDVLSVKRKGWSICALPRERHTLGVRYSFLESGPEFRDRGLAALRRGEDGSVDLELGMGSSAPCSFGVQVKAHGEVAASSHVAVLQAETLEASILQARNSLFDEELYHEMSREARALTNRGVKCVGDSIVIPLEEEVSLLVNLSSEDSHSIEGHTSKHVEYENVAQFSATAFRLLLSHWHRQQYLRRTELPPPLKKRKQPRPLPVIIQPLVSHLEHRSFLKRLNNHLRLFGVILAKASVPWTLLPAKGNVHLDRLLRSKDAKNPAFANKLIDVLCSPLQSTIPIQLGTEDSSITVIIRTHSSGTEFRTEKVSTAESSSLSQIPDEMHFSDVASLEAYLSHTIVLYLVDLVTAQDERWYATYPDEGELTTEPTLDGEVETLSVHLDHTSLEIAWRSSHSTDNLVEGVQWSSDQEGISKSFAEEVRRLGSLRTVVPNSGLHAAI